MRLALLLFLAVRSAALAADQQLAVATRTSQPPTIDGDLSDPVWTQAIPIAEFTQQSPDERQPPSQRTEVRILYDDRAIYFAFRCFDTDPKSVVANMTRRDRDSFSDAIGLDLDTAGDHRSAWHFEVSAAGVQRDGVRTGDDPDANINWDWDARWDSAARRDSVGWAVEIAIPLGELRYKPANAHEFRMEIRRFNARRSEIDQWIYIPRLESGEMLRYGRLVGLSDLAASHAWHLAPFVAAGARRRSSPPELQLPQGADSTVSAGLDARYNVTSNLTLTATVLPDFGQVEADQVKLNLTTFEIRYPEKRPFFLEGSDLFTMVNMLGYPTTPQLAYSRRIGASAPYPTLAGTTVVDSPAGAQILGAGKLTGRIGEKLNVALLDSVTATESATIADANGTKSSGRVAPMTNFLIGRLRSGLSDSLIGSAMLTSVLRREPRNSLGIDNLCPNGNAHAVDGRCMHDATTAGFDLRYASADGEWVAFGSILGSVMSGGPARTLPDGTIIGPGDAGLGWQAQAAKAGGHWTTYLFYNAFSPRLDINDAGMLTQQNVHSIHLETGWRELDRGPTRTIYAALDLDGANSWDGVRTLRTLDLLTLIDWQNAWYTELHLQRYLTIFDNRETTDGARTERPAGWGMSWIWRTDRTRPFYGEFTGSARNTWQGYTLSLSGSAVFRPSESFEISLAPTMDRVTGDWRWVASSTNCSLVASSINPDGSKTYCFGLQSVEAPGLTLRTLFTFTPAITLQTYAQLFFSSVHYGELRDTTRSGTKPYLHFADLGPSTGNPSGFDTHDAVLNLNVVFRWAYQPGSALYLVYTRSHAGGLAPPQQDGNRQPIRPPVLDFGALGRGPIEDVVLLKLSYDFAG